MNFQPHVPPIQTFVRIYLLRHLYGFEIPQIFVVFSVPLCNENRTNTRHVFFERLQYLKVYKRPTKRTIQRRSNLV